MGTLCVVRQGAVAFFVQEMLCSGPVPTLSSARVYLLEPGSQALPFLSSPRLDLTCPTHFTPLQKERTPYSVPRHTVDDVSSSCTFSNLILEPPSYPRLDSTRPTTQPHPTHPHKHIRTRCMSHTHHPSTPPPLRFPAPHTRHQCACMAPAPTSATRCQRRPTRPKEPPLHRTSEPPLHLLHRTRPCIRSGGPSDHATHARMTVRRTQRSKRRGKRKERGLSWAPRSGVATGGFVTCMLAM